MSRKARNRLQGAEERDHVPAADRQTGERALLSQTEAVHPSLLRRMAGDPGAARPESVLQLQRLVGNRAVGRWITGTPARRASPLPTGTIQRKREQDQFPNHEVHRQDYDQLNKVYETARDWTLGKEGMFTSEKKPLERSKPDPQSYYHQELTSKELKKQKPKKALKKKGKYYYQLRKGRTELVKSEGPPEYETLTNPKAGQFVIPQVFTRGSPVSASAILWRMYKQAVDRAQKEGCIFVKAPKLEGLNEIVMQDIANQNTNEVAYMCFDNRKEMEAGKEWAYKGEECKALLGSELGKVVFWIVINYSKLLKGKRIKSAEAKGGGRFDFPKMDYLKFTLE